VPPTNLGGLSGRQVEVRHVAAIEHTTQQIADRLYIAVKTAGKTGRPANQRQS